MATRTATIPLRTSSMPDTTAARGPRARRTFAPPVRPLPIVRGSGPPVARAMTTPHGIPPIRYATTATTAAIAIWPASIGREYSHRDSAGDGRLRLGVLADESRGIQLRRRPPRPVDRVGR